MSRLSSISLLGCLLAFLLASCSKNEEAAGEYDNWRARNQAYVDSIANLAKQGLNGWKRTRVFYVQQEYADANPSNNNIYVYLQKTTAGIGTVTPHYSDTVRVQYRGRLIPSKSYPEGKLFGQSFGEANINEINEATAVPALLAVSQNVPGFCQALQEMVEGDVVHMVIPYDMAYGATSTNSSIPDCSTLVFDVKLVKVYKRGESTAWR